MWQVQMQFIPENDTIWVARLTESDPIYEYSDVMQAAAKALELQALDSSGRKYTIVQI
jgi:hypothetical protein